MNGYYRDKDSYIQVQGKDFLWEFNIFKLLAGHKLIFTVILMFLSPA